jgi:hypothetical protein
LPASRPRAGCRAEQEARLHRWSPPAARCLRARLAAGLTPGRAGCRRRRFASVTAVSRAQSGGDGGLSVTTLVIASCSAVVATVVVPLFWEKGTLIATAVTPIVVAVVSELLHKPVERIGAVGVRHPTTGGTAIGERGPPRPAEEPFEPLSAAERVELPEVWSGDRHVYYERPRRRLDRRQLKIALVTGVLGFVLAGGVRDGVRAGALREVGLSG